MSEPLRVALVAEGPTDYEIIQASLKAFLTRPFVLTQLQPEATRPVMGTGWCGVLKWCDAVGQRHGGTLDTDPLLEDFDLLILHLDIDVSTKDYADGGSELETRARQKSCAVLPCAQPCPPASTSAASLAAVLNCWLAPAHTGRKTALCLPAQSSGTWLAVAVLPTGNSLLAGAECNLSLEDRLAQLPKTQRIRKTAREYRTHAPKVTARWPDIKALCTQALVFEQAVLAAL